jgi:heme-degrading monooxygenase HmoA
MSTLQLRPPHCHKDAPKKTPSATNRRFFEGAIIAASPARAVAPPTSRTQRRAMIVEINMVQVSTERTVEFETAFAEAAELLLEVAGCRSAQLFRCVERPGRYQIQLGWERLADHVDHYPATAQAAGVRKLLMPLIDSADMAHFEPVALC